MHIKRVDSLPKGMTWMLVEECGSAPVAFTTGALGDYLARRALLEREKVAHAL